MTRLSLETFDTQFNPPERFAVSYNDPGHLEPDKYIRLATFELRSNNTSYDQSTEDLGAVPFVVRPESAQSIRDQLGPQVEENFADAASRDIRKYLADTFLRTGLMLPQIEFRDMSTLVQTRQLIVLTDTNILNLGVLDYIIDCREEGMPLLAVVPITSLMELQKYSDARPGRFGKLNADKLRSLIGRSMGVTAIHHIQRLKQRCLVEFVEVDPTTLQFFYSELPGQSGSTKADRIIIESIKQVVGHRRFSASPKGLTGDKNVARFLRLENIDAIYVGQYALPEELLSLTYDIFGCRYFAANLHFVLWELAEAFGNIRIDDLQSQPPGEGIVHMRYPSENWTLDDWLERRMDVEMDSAVTS